MGKPKNALVFHNFSLLLKINQVPCWLVFPLFITSPHSLHSIAGFSLQSGLWYNRLYSACIAMLLFWVSAKNVERLALDRLAKFLIYVVIIFLNEPHRHIVHTAYRRLTKFLNGEAFNFTLRNDIWIEVKLRKSGIVPLRSIWNDVRFVLLTLK